ncbi:hypothetical protein D049_1797 [Vibrio parahaemolyticus VPTS-2010]|nr:hypothetical protein D049_1797 [Vibrio parahaemolyticus VPTS-2010]
MPSIRQTEQYFSSESAATFATTSGSSSSPDTSKWIFTCVKIRGAVSRRSVVSLALTDTTFWPALFKPSTTSTELQPPAAISTISIGLGAVAPPLPSITIE